MKVHEVIISLASNENQEANLAKAREQLTQLLVEVHFTSAIWTEPVNTSRKKPYLNQLCWGPIIGTINLIAFCRHSTSKRVPSINSPSVAI